MTGITIDGELFRVEVEGDPARPVLLLSNSLGADLTMWDAQMPAFLREFRVVRYDPRGHGRSTTAGAPYSLARLGADVVAILDALEIERAHFLGISMGGAVGQWLLVNAPERIDRAVLANTNARFAPPHLWNERIRTVRAQGTQALAAGTMERWFSAGFRAEAADKVAAMDEVFRATSREGYAAAAGALRDMDMREALHAIDRPVLLMTGRDDGIASAADIAAMLGAIPDVRHVQLACQHISNIEAQTAFNAAAIGFLTGPLRAGKPKAKPATKPAIKPATRRRPGAAARSPLKRTPAAATPVRRRPAATATRSTAKPATPKPAPAKAAPRKAARPAAARRVSPVAARAPVAKAVAKKAAVGKAAAAKSPARKAKPAVKPTAKAKPRRKAMASVATRKAVAKKAVTKKAVKAVVKKVVAKKGAKPATKKVASKPTARRPTKKRPGRTARGGRR